MTKNQIIEEQKIAIGTLLILCVFLFGMMIHQSYAHKESVVEILEYHKKHYTLNSGIFKKFP